jgi:hypothetical protein
MRGGKVTGTAENQYDDISSLTGRDILPNRGTIITNQNTVIFIVTVVRISYLITLNLMQIVTLVQAISQRKYASRGMLIGTHETNIEIIKPHGIHFLLNTIRKMSYSCDSLQTHTLLCAAQESTDCPTIHRTPDVLINLFIYLFIYLFISSHLLVY